MIALIKKEMFNDRVREMLSFVPSAIFPAIIFPAIFINDKGLFEIDNNTKILAAIIAMFESVKVIKHRRHEGACKEILSQQFWWHQTALLPKAGSSSNKALGADMFSTE